MADAIEYNGDPPFQPPNNLPPHRLTLNDDDYFPYHRCAQVMLDGCDIQNLNLEGPCNHCSNARTESGKPMICNAIAGSILNTVRKSVRAAQTPAPMYHFGGNQGQPRTAPPASFNFMHPHQGAYVPGAFQQLAQNSNGNRRNRRQRPAAYEEVDDDLPAYRARQQTRRLDNSAEQELARLKLENSELQRRNAGLEEVVKTMATAEEIAEKDRQIAGLRALLSEIVNDALPPPPPTGNLMRPPPPRTQSVAPGNQNQNQHYLTQSRPARGSVSQRSNRSGSHRGSPSRRRPEPHTRSQAPYYNRGVDTWRPGDLKARQRRNQANKNSNVRLGPDRVTDPEATVGLVVKVEKEEEEGGGDGGGDGGGGAEVEINRGQQ